MKSIDEFVNKIICGDCLAVMKGLPTGSIDMCLTSPPYWGLRDYGVEQIFGGDKDCEHEWGKSIITEKSGGKGHKQDTQQASWFQVKQTTCNKCNAWKGQLGLEPTPELYVDHMTEIFHEVKRVLKKEGTLWLNIGDTYSNSGGCGWTGLESKNWKQKAQPHHLKSLPPKCLCMIPERLAWSLIQDGWILRNKIIWHKPNPMPSSVKDRFSNTWEYVYLFAKSQRYYFDLDAVREEYKEGVTRWGGNLMKPAKKTKYSKDDRKTIYCRPTEERLWRKPGGKNPGDVIEAPSETRTLGAILGTGKAVKVPGGQGWTGHPKGGGAACQKDPRWCPPEGRNPRDFWSITTQPFPEAHFAVFPEKLCEKPIKAGCPEEVCKKCGKARERIIKKGDLISSCDYLPMAKKKQIGTSRYHEKDPYGALPKRETKTIGWTSCDCNAGFEGGILLDPFCGAGTALYVAKKMCRRYIGIDIKQEYVDMAKKRLAQGVL